MRPSEKFPMNRSTHARNLHCSPAVLHGAISFSHCFSIAADGAFSQIERWKAATSFRQALSTHVPD